MGDVDADGAGETERPARRHHIATVHGERTVEALEDLVSYCDEAAELVADGKDTMLSDWRTQRAAEAVLNRIGDTINSRLPPELLVEYDGQPWSDIVGQRIVVAHVYHQLNYSRVWNTLTEHVPSLRRYVLGAMLGDDSP